MTATTPKQLRGGPGRWIVWVPGTYSPAEGRGVVKIQARKQLNHYFLRVIPCDFGRGFEMIKLEGEETTRYHIALDPRGRRHSCECKGFLRWGHCKHVEGLLALTAAGQFPGSTAKAG